MVLIPQCLNPNRRNFNWIDLNHKHTSSNFKHRISLKIYELEYKFISYLYFNRCRQRVHNIYVSLTLLTTVLMPRVNISVRIIAAVLTLS